MQDKAKSMDEKFASINPVFLGEDNRLATRESWNNFTFEFSVEMTLKLSNEKRRVVEHLEQQLAARDVRINALEGIVSLQAEGIKGLMAGLGAQKLQLHMEKESSQSSEERLEEYIELSPELVDSLDAEIVKLKAQLAQQAQTHGGGDGDKYKSVITHPFGMYQEDMSIELVKVLKKRLVQKEIENRKLEAKIVSLEAQQSQDDTEDGIKHWDQQSGAHKSNAESDAKDPDTKRSKISDEDSDLTSTGIADGLEKRSDTHGSSPQSQQINGTKVNFSDTTGALGLAIGQSSPGTATEEVVVADKA